jgi:4-hydroxy-2-oxoheptanedioate aldolase
MKSNPVRAKLKQGKPSIGTWLTLPDPVAAHLMARVGFDWLTVELEHTPVNLETAATSFAVIAGAGTVPLARVPWNNGENLKRVLDSGAWGVVVPMVNSQKEAEAVVHSTRYAPEGHRSIGGSLHAANFSTDPATYYRRANEEILVVVMIEHVRSIANLESILSVPGIDVAFIGPNDLLNSMGKPPAFDSEHPEFRDALKQVVKTACRSGVAPGIHVANARAAQQRLDEGFQFIAVASEAGLMLSAADDTVRTLGLGVSGDVAKY